MRIIRKKHRDPQRVYPAGLCGLCGGELYPGESCWHLGGRRLCEACAVSWVMEELASCRLRCGEAGL